MWWWINAFWLGGASPWSIFGPWIVPALEGLHIMFISEPPHTPWGLGDIFGFVFLEMGFKKSWFPNEVEKVELLLWALHLCLTLSQMQKSISSLTLRGYLLVLPATSPKRLWITSSIPGLPAVCGCQTASLSGTRRGSLVWQPCGSCVPGQRDKAVKIASCGDWSPKGQYDGYSPGLVEEMGTRDLSSRIWVLLAQLMGQVQIREGVGRNRLWIPLLEEAKGKASMWVRKRKSPGRKVTELCHQIHLFYTHFCSNLFMKEGQGKCE